MFVDSHCHLNLLDLKKLGMNLDQVVQTALDHKVNSMLTIATHFNQHEELIKIAEQFATVKISFGCHPEHANEGSFEQFTLDHLLEMVSSKHVVAIGEIGLDYYHTNEQEFIIKQQDWFIRQIDLAKNIKKPLIIHSRMAQTDTIKILISEQAASVGGVMHCFTENWEMAKQALDLGFYISFAGIITFKNAESLREVVKKVPIDRILTETDSPFLAPEPYRGKINQPCYVPYVTKAIATIKNLPLEELADIIVINYKKLFFNNISTG